MTDTAPTTAAEKPNGQTLSHHAESTLPDAGNVDGRAKPRPEPQLAHERDESSSSQASASVQHEVIGKQAYEDAVGPGVDTDRGPVTDKLYNESVAPRPDDVPPRR